MQRLWNIVSGTQPAQEYVIGDRRLVQERELSEGGFAFVVRVRDVEDGQVFALKKILCQDEEGFKMATREAEILEHLPSHKNIVGYFGHAVVAGPGGRREVLILLEYCPGGHLLDFMDQHGGVLPEAELLRAFTDVAEALFCLHSHSPPVQHRDLKLENVLRGADKFWKVVDFGSWSDVTVDLQDVPSKQLAAIGEEIVQHTTMMYRPPEMVDVYLRLPITCAVDMWMLGCVLFTLMYYRHPFQDGATLAIRNANFTLPARSPAPSAKLVDLVFWLLAQDPRHRPNARKLVMSLWQWKDIDALELPEPVVQRRDKALTSEEAKCTGSKAASRRARQQVRTAQAAAVSPVPSASPPEPWVAFEDFQSAPANPSGTAAANTDAWDAFADFSSAPAQPEVSSSPASPAAIAQEEIPAAEEGSDGSQRCEAAVEKCGGKQCETDAHGEASTQEDEKRTTPKALET